MTSLVKSNSKLTAATIAYVVCDSETDKRWSGPFSKD